MEGISGITQREHVMKGNEIYPLGCRLMEGDINACVEGCFRAGATEVIVKDGHCSGVNVNPFEIDPRAELIQGNTGSIRFAGLEGSAAIIFLGYHAMAGTHQAVLEHTYSSASIQNMWVDGKLAGEFAIDAIIAAEHGVPTIMVSGDDKVCKEAKEFIPGLVCCQVKKAFAINGAQLLSPAKAHDLIIAKTVEAISRLKDAELPENSSPTVLKTELVERGGLPVNSKGFKQIDGRTYEIKSETLEKALMS